MENLKNKAKNWYEENREALQTLGTAIGVAGGLVGIGYLLGRRTTVKILDTALYGHPVKVNLSVDDVVQLAEDAGI